MKGIENVEQFVMFCCVASSGHTVIAGILDAHPKIQIGEEQRSLTRWADGHRTDRDEILRACVKDSTNRMEGTRSYRRRICDIQGQHQGTAKDKLTIVGDKTGWDIPGYWLKHDCDSTPLKRFVEAMAIPVKVIHVTRNPFDIVGGRTHSHKRSNDVAENVRYFTSFAGAMDYNLYQSGIFVKEYIHQIRIEDLIKYPDPMIKNLYRFLNVEWDDGLIDACKGVLLEEPSKHSHQIDWKDQAGVLQDCCNKYWWLRGYGLHTQE